MTDLQQPMPNFVKPSDAPCVRNKTVRASDWQVRWILANIDRLIATSSALGRNKLEDHVRRRFIRLGLATPTERIAADYEIPVATFRAYFKYIEDELGEISGPAFYAHGVLHWIGIDIFDFRPRQGFTRMRPKLSDIAALGGADSVERMAAAIERLGGLHHPAEPQYWDETGRLHRFKRRYRKTHSKNYLGEKRNG